MKKWDISLLYVEDERILRNIYDQILSPHVRSLTLAENGDEGFQKFIEIQPDLVITDIKMPVMNGLDMARKIKKQFPDARIVVMSAYGEAQYFMRAIETGVKGFLLKPVDNEKLFKVIDEQAREVMMASAIRLEEEKRLKAEAALRTNEAILQAVSDVSEIMLRQSLDGNVINMVLERLGTATKVSRVYIFEYHEINGDEHVSQKYEWVDDETNPQLDNIQLQNVPFESGPFVRWRKHLHERQPIYGLVKNFPEGEKEVLQSQEIVSIMIVPIFIGESFSGFIGFDDCVKMREWTQVEANTLETAASILGSAIKRSTIENELRKLNSELEERVAQRTKKLQREVAERQFAEEMLRESEEKYRLIFENANDGIFLTANGQIQFINPKAYEITGYQPKMVMGKSFVNFIHPDFREMVRDNHFKRLQGEDVPESYDILIIDAKNRQKWVELKSNLIKWENELAVLTFMTDISTRKAYEKELEVLNQNLEERVKQELDRIEKQRQALIQKSKLESLGELAAGMAHEINQPMGGIAMSLDNILFEIENATLTDNYLRKKIGLMHKDVNRIKELINHVRVFSRDQENVTDTSYNVNATINNALMLINRKFIEHSVDLELNLLSKNLMLSGNPLRFEQVILNLLNNAKYAVDKKSKEIGPAFTKKISLKTLLENDSLKVEITDNGIGIPKENLLRIFDPFFTTKQHDEGTGLGLSISYGIIKEMGGSIEAESVEGEHTTITIYIPLDKQNKANI